MFIKQLRERVGAQAFREICITVGYAVVMFMLIVSLLILSMHDDSENEKIKHLENRIVSMQAEIDSLESVVARSIDLQFAEAKYRCREN